MAPTGWALLLVALAGFLTFGAAQDCPVAYGYGSSKPLILGGMYDKGVCVSGCKSKTDYWGNICAMDPNKSDQWGTCTRTQRRQMKDMFQVVRGGAVLNMRPCDLWPYIRGRTLWLLGDSFAKDIYKALQCFLIDFWDHQECKASTDEGAVQQLFNIPVQTGQSKCIHLPHMTRICMVRTVLGQQYVSDDSIPNGGVLPLLQARFAKREDIFVVNFGVWHRKQGEEGYRQYDQALKDLVSYYQRTRDQFPYLLFKETPADHRKNMDKKICVPFSGLRFDKNSGSLVASSNPAARSASITWLLEGTRLNRQARDILGNGGVHVFGRLGYEMSVALYQQHIGMRGVSELDCLHFCQLWVYELLEALKSGAAGVQPISGNSGTFQCIPQTGF